MCSSASSAASFEIVQDMNKHETTVLPCPRCGEPVTWNERAEWKPFCSERCKLIDLGAWFSEEHTIPGEPLDPENSQEHLPNHNEK